MAGLEIVQFLEHERDRALRLIVPVPRLGAEGVVAAEFVSDAAELESFASGLIEADAQ